MFDIHRLARGYRLQWPTELFRDELTQVLDKASFYETSAQLKLLFEEAFVGEEPATDVPHPSGFSEPDNAAFLHGKRVLAQVDKLPLYEPRVYYQDRHTSQQVSSSDTRSPEAQRVEVQNSIRAAIRDLDGAGYFDQATGGECADSDNPAGHHASALRQKIARSAGLHVAWPLRELAGIGDEQLLTDDAFFTLIEVLHDLVARPRSRWWHDYDEHFVYTDFDQFSGEAVYRWRINELLDSHRLSFRIADQGSDKGSVVTTVLDPRADLQQHAAAHTSESPENRDQVEHAIRLFRGRGATIDDKRSACKDLADILEYRRAHLKKHLASKDEGDLFQIANQFRVRHHKSDQRSDYAEEFLDWIFWNFLSAVELTNRLLARDATSGGGDA